MTGSLDLLIMTLVRIALSGRSGQGLSNSDYGGKGTEPPTSQAIQAQQGPCPGSSALRIQSMSLLTVSALLSRAPTKIARPKRTSFEVPMRRALTLSPRVAKLLPGHYSDDER